MHQKIRNSVTLALLCVAAASDAAAESRIDRSQYDISALETAVNIFRLDQRQYPDRLQLLIDYGFIKRVPRDRWGREYEYSLDRPPFAEADLPFHIWTLGADGIPGGEGDNQDIGNW